ncbi:unnamed protein product [Hyaloperonospora brassicae]|uniref:RING-type domain-containing protein n=1 Tax=Hyaloperonospora brassicae TaxID=162125 RepID=A0AAV0UYX7_HYABA|nr:unnamed protein product [Hyaloperonospora brassicae]
MERFGDARLVQLGEVVTGRRYVLLTAAATGIAMASAVQRLRPLSSIDSPLSLSTRFAEELMNSRVGAVIMLHFILVILYYAFLLLARAALGTLQPMELQQTKETLVPFVLLRCQLLLSTMEFTAPGQGIEIARLVSWLAVLVVLRALLALTQIRFQHLLTRPMTRVRDLQRLGAVLGLVIVLNLGLLAACTRFGLFWEKIVYVPWFEASLMLLRTLELGLQVGFHSLDVSGAAVADDGVSALGWWENREFYLLLLQTVLCGCYLVQLVAYYLYVVSVDQFRVSLFDLVLVLNVKNATVRLLEKVKHVKLYHRVVLDLDHLFPDATSEELKSVADDVCAICLKSMSSHAKKLDCGHLFHRLCLRQCLQKASESDALVGLNPLTRMLNGLGMESPFPQVAGTRSSGSPLMRCPICRKQVCGGQCDKMTCSPPGESSRQLEGETEELREAGQPQHELATTDTAQDDVHDHVVAGDDGGASEEVIRFSTAFLSRWVPFPNFSFEIVRHRNVELTEEMLQQIWEVFPQYTLEEIRADVAQTRSVERTMERILHGHLDEQRIAMEQQNFDRADMDANELFGGALVD